MILFSNSVSLQQTTELMNHRTYKFTLLALLPLMLVLSNCNPPTKKAPAEVEQKVDKTSKEYTSAYICPMHCEGSGSEEPGKCPVCGMDYHRGSPP